MASSGSRDASKNPKNSRNNPLPPLFTRAPLPSRLPQPQPPPAVARPPSPAHPLVPPASIGEPPVLPNAAPAVPVPTPPAAAAEIEPSLPTNTRRAARTNDQKIFDILGAIQDAGWSLGQFLHLLFEHTGQHGSRSERHRGMVSKFLKGQNKAPYRPSVIVNLMYTDHLGIPSPQSEEYDWDFSVGKPHSEIRHARPALSSWAASLCADRIEKQAKKATQPDAGLHARIRTSQSQGDGSRRAARTTTTKPVKYVAWTDVGSGVVETVRTVLETECPLLWNFMIRAGSKSPRPGSVVVKRVFRPVETVVTAALSDVLFSRNQGANLLQLARGIALFATRAEASIYRVGSRFGNNPVYNTITHALETLSVGGQEWLREMAASDVEWLMLIIDNVQHYHRQREMRFGRENTMIKGVTGTGVAMFGASAEAWDLNALIAARLSDSRYALLTSDLLAKIDFPHLERMSQLHWLDVLISHVPALACYRKELEELFGSRVKPLRMPEDHRSVIQPLQSSGCDPAQTTEMRQALLEFFGKQLDQTPENWKRRAVLVGGDGGTFEMLLRLQKYLQTQATEYDRMDWLVPVLQLWHMKWAALGRIFENWWGSSTSSDASCLGHSAKAAGKKTPPNLKKPDFNAATETLFLVGEARMMDCWSVILGVDDVQAHFEAQKEAGAITSLQDLLALALKLHRTYSSTRGALQALEPYDDQNDSYRAPETKDKNWKVPVHKGPPPKKTKKKPAETSLAAELLGVAPAPQAAVSASSETPEEPSTSNASSDRQEDVPAAGFMENAGFVGDRWLANSINGLCDFLPYRHWCRSTSLGWIGDVWEVVKLETIKFAGSGHNQKYRSFGLEMFIMLEFECPPALRTAILQSLLVNPTGRKGHFKEGDLMQEHLINRLDRVMQNQDKSYDDRFIREVVWPLDRLCLQ